MTDILDDLRKVEHLRGDTFSSAEVIAMVGRAAKEIERLRMALYQASSSRNGWIDINEAAGQALSIANGRINTLKTALKHIAEFEQDIHVKDADAMSYMRETAKDALATAQQSVQGETK